MKFGFSRYLILIIRLLGKSNSGLLHYKVELLRHTTFNFKKIGVTFFILRKTARVGGPYSGVKS